MAVASNKGLGRALFGAAFGLFASSSLAANAAEQITFVSQGGAYQKAQTVAILDPAARSSASPSIRTAFPTPGR